MVKYFLAWGASGTLGSRWRRVGKEPDPRGNPDLTNGTGLAQPSGVAGGVEKAVVSGAEARPWVAR